MKRHAVAHAVALAAALAVLATGCSSGASRQAAGADSALLPACTVDSTSECTAEASLDSQDRVLVSNGATVVFTRNGAPVQAASLSVLCWSEGDDVEAGSCTEDGKVPPPQVDIKATTLAKDGTQWPALAVRVGTMTDANGEEYLPLPATALMGVTTDQGILPITVEVACCERLR